MKLTKDMKGLYDNILLYFEEYENSDLLISKGYTHTLMRDYDKLPNKLKDISVKYEFVKVALELTKSECWFNKELECLDIVIEKLKDDRKEVASIIKFVNYFLNKISNTYISAEANNTIRLFFEHLSSYVYYIGVVRLRQYISCTAVYNYFYYSEEGGPGVYAFIDTTMLKLVHGRDCKTRKHIYEKTYHKFYTHAKGVSRNLQRDRFIVNLLVESGLFTESQATGDRYKLLCEDALIFKCKYFYGDVHKEFYNKLSDALNGSAPLELVPVYTSIKELVKDVDYEPYIVIATPYNSVYTKQISHLVYRHPEQHNIFFKPNHFSLFKEDELQSVIDVLKKRHTHIDIDILKVG